MFEKLIPAVACAPRDQPPCCASAASLNESTIREIITGRYLTFLVGHSSKRAQAKRRTHTTLPLIVIMKSADVNGGILGISEDPPGWKELD